MLLTVSIIVFIISTLLLGRLLWRKLPDIKILNLSSLVDEQIENAKSKILHAKLTRSTLELRKKWQATVGQQSGMAMKLVTKWRDKIIALESRYQRPEVVPTSAPLTIDQLFVAAREAIDDQQYAEAEKHLIEVLARDAKSVRAYELLGDLYVLNKSYHQAEEVFQYLIKFTLLQGVEADKPIKKGKWQEIETDLLGSLDLSPEVAIYYDDLGKVYELMQKPDKALDCYLKTVTIEPNNPRYLDKLIGASIAVGDEGLAKKTFRRLKKINPENAKLSQLQQDIEKMNKM
jgi:tetratricopeptide (TPR) repeat protein